MLKTKKLKKMLLLTAGISVVPVVFCVSCAQKDTNRPTWGFTTTESNSFVTDDPKWIHNQHHEESKPTIKKLTELYGYKIVKSTGDWDNVFNISRIKTQTVLENLNFKKVNKNPDITVKEFIDLFLNTRHKIVKKHKWKMYQFDYFEFFKDPAVSKYFTVDKPSYSEIDKRYKRYMDIRFFFSEAEDKDHINLSIQMYHDDKWHTDRRRRRSTRVKRHDPTMTLTPLITIQIPWNQ